MASHAKRLPPPRPWPPTVEMITARWPERSAFETPEARERRQIEKLEAWNTLPPSDKMLRCAAVCRKRHWSLRYIPEFGIATHIRGAMA